MLQDYPITGIVHSKLDVTKPTKKDPSKTWTARYLLLEVGTTKEIERKVDDKVSTQVIVDSEILKLEIDRRVNADHIDANDKVNVWFRLEGVKWTNPEGKADYFLKVIVHTIKHADIEVAREKSDKPFEATAPDWKPNVDDNEDDLPF